jgi:hypothetical protein
MLVDWHRTEQCPRRRVGGGGQRTDRRRVERRRWPGETAEAAEEEGDCCRTWCLVCGDWRG